MPIGLMNNPFKVSPAIARPPIPTPLNFVETCPSPLITIPFVLCDSPTNPFIKIPLLIES